MHHGRLPNGAEPDVDCTSAAHRRNVVERYGGVQGRLDEAALVPALLVWGDRDGVVGVDSGERLARALGARIMVLAGVGHLPFAEAPEASNRAMVEWLRG